MAVPNIFANVTTSIPLSQLDANFATAITLGNTAVYLGNTTTTIGNLTLTNANVSSVSTPITPAQGGTGLATLTANNVLIGNGTSNVTFVAPGTSGNVLTSNGTVWQSTAASSPTSIANGTSNVTVNSSGGNITMGNAGTTTFLIDKGKTLALQGATQSTGTGIAFPATQSASTDANTLDDYEEGTFTPILADNVSSSNAATMTVQEGYYTKIGNTVTIQIQIAWSDKGSMGAGNNTRIYGTPFSAKSNSSNYFWPALISMSSGNTGFIAGLEGNGTTITLELVNAPLSELSTSYVSASGRLLIQFTYRTSI